MAKKPKLRAVTYGDTFLEAILEVLKEIKKDTAASRRLLKRIAEAVESGE